MVVLLSACGFHYWELRWQLQTANFRNDLFTSETRILRDEMNELRSRPTYKDGVFDTIIRTKMEAGFDDGLRHAYENLPVEAADNVSTYHRAISHSWGSVYYQQQLAEKKLKEEKEKAFSAGRKDGYDSAVADIKQGESHPDFEVPRNLLKKELEAVSPFKTVENKDE